MTQVWSATHINGNILGGGTTTATCTGGGGISSSVYAGTGVSTGKYYWEAQLTANNGANFLNGTVGLGLGNTSTSVANDQYLGLGFDSIGAYITDGGTKITWWVNNTSPLNFALGFTVANGDVFGFALDLVNNTFWFRDITQSSGWFGSAGSADPATNTNGFSLVQTNFTVTSNPVVAGATLFDGGDAVVGFFSPASWTGSIPTGFVGTDAISTSISGNYAGRGILAANRAVVRAPSASRFGGSGALSAKATFSPSLSATYLGAGAFRANATLSSSFVSGAFLGSGSAVTARLAAQAVTASAYSGTGAITAVASISLGSSGLSAKFLGSGSFSAAQSAIWAIDSPSYVGAGTFAADATVFRPGVPLTAAFLGSGSFFAAPIGLFSGRAQFGAAGSITANITIPAHSDASAAFSAVGSLALPRLTALRSISTAYRGAGTSAVTLSAGTPTAETFFVDELGNRFVDELGNSFVTEFQPSTQLAGGFNGGGSLTITQTILRAGGFAGYTGAGSFVATASLITSASGIVRYTGAGSLIAPLTVHTPAVTAVASFAGSGSLAARVVATLRGQVRFVGSGAFSTGENVPAVLARCFGTDAGIFFPPVIADAFRFAPATASDAARAAVPSIYLTDVQIRFVAAGDAARGLSATTDVAIGRSTPADVPATSIVVAET